MWMVLKGLSERDYIGEYKWLWSSSADNGMTIRWPLKYNGCVLFSEDCEDLSRDVILHRLNAGLTLMTGWNAFWHLWDRDNECHWISYTITISWHNYCLIVFIVYSCVLSGVLISDWLQRYWMYYNKYVM